MNDLAAIKVIKLEPGECDTREACSVIIIATGFSI